MRKAEKVTQIQAMQLIVVEGLLPPAEDVDWLCTVAIEALQPPSKRLDGVDYEGYRFALYTWLGHAPRGTKVSPVWVRYVNGLVRAGWTADDIYTVIAYKGKEWAGTDYAKHLVPKTLFSHKHFEAYLMAANEQSTPQTTPLSHRPYNPEED